MISNAIAIIPARGGSKRIPRKNIKSFLGQPILTYSIAAATQAGCFDTVMVSTDDNEIAAIARQAKADVPFIRTRETSGDFATTADVLAEVLAQYERLGKTFTYACCIYPTAPFITPLKLKAGYKLIKRSKVDAVVPVMRYEYPIQRAFEIKNSKLRMFWPENREVRSQDLNPAYHDAGQFYWLNVRRFFKTRAIFGPNTLPLEVPATEVQDIDTAEDWLLAELKFRMLSKKTV